MLPGGTMRKSFKDSLKVLEADIQHANTLYVRLWLLIFISSKKLFLSQSVFAVGKG